MKKFLQIIVAALVSVTFMGAAAGAQSVVSCTSNTDVTNTGSGNTTVVTCDNEHTATITCSSGVLVGNYNEQDANSGSGSSSGGPVATGTVINYNGTQTTIGVTSCGATTTTTSPSPSSSVTPTVKPASLPNTANSDTASIIALSLAVAAGVVALSRVAVAAYRHIGNK